jgi:hypothetical protein
MLLIILGAFVCKLNKVFDNIIDDDQVYPNYGVEGITIEDLRHADNVTATVIYFAHNIYNIIGLFKFYDAKLKIDLAKFNAYIFGPSDNMILLFKHIARKDSCYTIENIYNILFDIENYVCGKKGLYKTEDGTFATELNTLKVFEKFEENGLYDTGSRLQQQEQAKPTIINTLASELAQKRMIPSYTNVRKTQKVGVGGSGKKGKRRNYRKTRKNKKQ